MAGHSTTVGPLSLDFGVKAEAGVFSLNNDKYGQGLDFDSSTRNDKSLSWSELYLHPKVTASIPVATSKFWGEYSFVAAATGGDGDGAGSTAGGEADVSTETALLGWKSGKTPGWADEDGVEVHGGRGRLVVGEGFVVGDGVRDGGGLAAFSLAPRKSFDHLAVASVAVRPVTGEIFVFDTDNTQGRTRGFGGDLKISLGDYGEAGALYLALTDSKIASRDGMRVTELRYYGAPFAIFTNKLRLRLEYAAEANASSQEAPGVDAHAYSAGLSYLFPWWGATLSISYNLYTGDKADTADNEAWDPLFQSADGLGNFGWRPGMIVGNYFYTNSNLVDVTTALLVSPAEKISLGVAFYHLDVAEKHLFDQYMGNIHLGDELNIYADMRVTPNIAISAAYGHAWTGDGPRALGFVAQQDLVRAIMRVEY